MSPESGPKTFPDAGRRAIVYAMHDRRGGVEDFVLFALESLRPHAAHLLVIADGSLTDEARRALEATADEVISRAGVDSGLWAYQAALEHLGEGAAAFDEVVLTGDGWFGPVHPFEPVFGDLSRRKLDLWSINDRREPARGRRASKRDGSVRLTRQWIAARQRVVASDAWKRYWKSLPPKPRDHDSLWAVEQDFTLFFTARGFRIGAAFPEESYPADEPAMYNTQLVIADGCPVVVRGVFDGYPLFFNQHAIEGRKIAAAMGAAGYPLELLWRNLARTLAPKSLNASAAMLEVLPDAARTPVPEGRRILAVVQIPRLEGVEDLFERVAWLGASAHVVAAVADSSMTDDVRALWDRSAAASTAGFEVRQAPGRFGADTASVFAECEDLLDESRFDLVVALHSGTPALPFRNAERYFRRQQVQNLLNSPGYVANLLALFEREPGLGLVFPPMPHIGISTMGEGWAGHRARAETILAQLGVHVPIDWATPHAPLGGMWIGRLEAVRALADLEWPAEDADLIGAHTRLHAYVAGEAGFHTRTVASSVHTGVSHGALEYKLDHMSLGFHGYPADYIGLLHRAGHAGTGSGRDLARMYLRANRPGLYRAMSRATGAARLTRRVVRRLVGTVRPAGGAR